MKVFAKDQYQVTQTLHTSHGRWKKFMKNLNCYFFNRTGNTGSTFTKVKKNILYLHQYIALTCFSLKKKYIYIMPAKMGVIFHQK